MLPWIFDKQLISLNYCSLHINAIFYFTSKVKLRLFYCHNFLRLWPQNTTLYTISRLKDYASRLDSVIYQRKEKENHLLFCFKATQSKR